MNCIWYGRGNNYPQRTVWDDPLNRDMMPYDTVYEPIVYGKTLFLGFNQFDRVTAIDHGNRGGKMVISCGWTGAFSVVEMARSTLSVMMETCIARMQSRKPTLKYREY